MIIRKLACAGVCMAAAIGAAQTPAQLKSLDKAGIHVSAVQAAQTNGQLAVTAPLNSPAALCYDSAGNFYIADQNNNIIRKVDTAGTITTAAGTGEQGFDGDGGAATQATLDTPAGVAIDASGNLYISDTKNQRIRKVSSNGTISTIAGTGMAGFSGDGAAATLAMISLPTAIAVDSSGNIFFADSNNNRVREIVTASGTIQTVAGNGEQGYSGDGGAATGASLDSPEGISVDASGNLYLSDTHNNRIRKVSGGVITTIAGDGSFNFAGDGSTATSGSFASPHGIAVNASGTTLYIADTDNQRIRQINSSNLLSTIAGNGQEGEDQLNGSATAASLDSPLGVAIGPQGTIAIADTDNDLVRAIFGGTVVTTAGGDQATSVLALSIPSQAITYGQGVLTATLTTSASSSGSVVFYDSGSPVSTVTLSSGVAVLNLGSLKVGTHNLSASFAGDGTNPASVSGVMVVAVSPLSITASITPISVQYGQAIPAITGSLSGVLAQDSGNVEVAFSTGAISTSSPGSYAVTGALSGSASANYTLSSVTGGITISKAASLTSLLSSVANTLVGSPVTLRATVATTTSGQPTGTVTFLDGTTALGTAQALSSGVASVTISSLTAGSHNLTVAYSGDTNFNASVSSVLVQQASDFSFSLNATGGATQTVVPGHTATYNLVASPLNGFFSFPVTLSVSGLPAGATATFSPSTLSLGSGSASFTLTIQTVATTAMAHPVRSTGGGAAVLALLLLPFSSCLRRTVRRWRPGVLIVVLGLSLAAVGGLAGCGTGTGYFGQNPQTYSVTITGTASGPNGTTLQHSSIVVLTVQ
ncbi:Ig-like domain repeat protein [Terriglobus sp. 2YAB30_2]|uniref:NHL domain-containing protein n=1 Tax=Terriglobus sp. 2YAB30_2 TaxID=3233023 RepID=UPI003F9C301C